MEDQKKLIRTQKEAAAFIGVTERTIRNWNKDKMMRCDNGEYIESVLIDFKEHGGKRGLNHIGILRVAIDFEKRIILDVSLCNPPS